MRLQQADSLGRIREVATPEGVRIPFEVASVGDRVLAFLIDFALIHAAVLGLALLGLLVLGAGAGLVASSIALFASFLLRNFYFVVLELRWGGTTIGKRKLGLRVISRDGGPLTVEAVFARNLTRDLEFFLPLIALIQPQLLLPGLPGWGALIGATWLLVLAALPLLNRDRLRCGDIVAGTLVVRAPRVQLLGDLAEERATSVFESAEQIQDKYVFSPAQLDLYGIHELQVLEDVLRQSRGYGERELVERVCDRIKRKIDWPRDQWEVDEHQFLLAFYKAQRARLEQRMLFGERRERKKE